MPVVPVGRRAAGNRDQLGVLHARQRLAVALLALVAERRVESATQNA
jgi:HAMP domain-containing protein